MRPQLTVDRRPWTRFLRDLVPVRIVCICILLLVHESRRFKVRPYVRRDVCLIADECISILVHPLTKEQVRASFLNLISLPLTYL